LDKFIKLVSCKFALLWSPSSLSSYLSLHSEEATPSLFRTDEICDISIPFICT
jgi:hypothetical protein